MRRRERCSVASGPVRACARGGEAAWGALGRWAVGLACLVAALVGLPRAARADGTLYVAGEGGEGKARRDFPLKRTEVRAEVSGEVVSASVTQTFANPYRERLEAVYVFPLPNHAAVDDMEMRAGGRVIKAQIARRAEAKAAYEKALASGQRAALLEQERQNVFTFSVGNIDPGGEIEVKVHYFELAKYDGGTYEMSVPLTVGPRYMPGVPLGGPPSGAGVRADTNRVPDASRVSPAYAPPTRSGHTVGVQVRLDAGAELATVSSALHRVRVTRPSAERAEVTLADDAEVPNRDFVLRWRLGTTMPRSAVFVDRAEAGDGGHVAVFLAPRADPPDAEIAPRELVFLLDTSGSMRGAPLAAATAAIRRAIDEARPRDTFQIIDFAERASHFAPEPLPNTPENRRKAHHHLDKLRAMGGTNQLAGIRAALTPARDPERVRFVMFFTDGFIGNESEVIALTKRELGEARVFGFGVGASVNRYLLDEVSFAGRGFAEYLLPGEDASGLVERFYRRIAKPYLTDVEIDWGTLPVRETYPRRLPDLSAFEPLVVYGRFDQGARGQVTVRGRLGRRPFSQAVTVNLAPDSPGNPAIAPLWAREKIAHLARLEHGSGSQEQAITRLALEHRLVTQYTSFVAVDLRRTGSGPPALAIAQPSEAPAGVDLRSAGGVAVGPSLAADEPSVIRPAESAREDMLPAPASAPPEMRRGGGCAGCTTAGETRPDTAAMGAIVIAVVLFARRLLDKKRHKGDE
jgi:Ca-activated chloride channel homolog